MRICYVQGLLTWMGDCKHMHTSALIASKTLNPECMQGLMDFLDKIDTDQIFLIG